MTLVKDMTPEEKRAHRHAEQERKQAAQERRYRASPEGQEQERRMRQSRSERFWKAYQEMEADSERLEMPGPALAIVAGLAGDSRRVLCLWAAAEERSDVLRTGMDDFQEQVRIAAGILPKRFTSLVWALHDVGALLPNTEAEMQDMRLESWLDNLDGWGLDSIGWQTQPAGMAGMQVIEDGGFRINRTVAALLLGTALPHAALKEAERAA